MHSSNLTHQPCSREARVAIFVGLERMGMTPDFSDKLEIIRIVRKIANDAGMLLGDCPLYPEIMIKGERGEKTIQALFGNVHPLGHGGMNEVVSGTECISGRKFVLRKPLAHCVEAYNRDEERIFREDMQTILQDLPPHPHTTSYWGRGLDPTGQEYNIWDEAEGTTLDNFSKQRELTIGEWLEIGIQLGHAIAYCHSKDIIHFDIKPENVFVRDTEGSLHVRLIDFDLARTPSRYIQQTKLDIFVGSPYYMPPEAFDRNIIYTPETEVRALAKAFDVYAFGFTLHRLLTGTYLCEGVDATLRAKFQGSFIPKFPEGTPEDIEDILIQACSKNWKERPSIEEMILFLRKLQNYTLKKELSKPVSRSILPSSPTEQIPDTHHREIGPYRELESESVPLPTGDGGIQKYLSIFADKWGRKLIGVPNEFPTDEEARAYYEEKKDFLHDMNRVREKYPELFPGVFDLIYEKDKKKVWIIRPFLDKLSLKEYARLKKITKEEGKKLMLDIARSLEAIEEAGYVHPGIHKENIYMIPMSFTPFATQKIDMNAVITGQNEAPQGTLMFHKDGFRLEVMETSQLQKKSEQLRDRNIDLFSALCREFIDETTAKNVSFCESWMQIEEYLRTGQIL